MRRGVAPATLRWPVCYLIRRADATVRLNLPGGCYGAMTVAKQFRKIEKGPHH